MDEKKIEKMARDFHKALMRAQVPHFISIAIGDDQLDLAAGDDPEQVFEMLQGACADFREKHPQKCKFKLH